MSDAEYEAIEKAFPAWAKAVRDRVKERPKTQSGIDYNLGYLSGLAAAMIVTRQCSRAYEFIRATEEREGRND